MYRAYWAIPRNMKTSKGVQVNAVFGFGSMLLQMLKTEEPDAVLFCFDAGDKTFRHVEYQEYKAGRADTPDDFYTQVPMMQSLVSTFGFATVAHPDYEADDYACAYARTAEKQGWRVTIISGDRDLFQLATENIRIAIPHKGYQAAEYLGPEQVKTKYGVTPEQIPSYKGLVGDPSDNLPGVKGIGPIAASALLNIYADMEDIYAHLDDIKPVWRNKLETDRKQAFFCQRMSVLICDMPLPLPFDEIEVGKIQTEPVLKLFQELEFYLLTRRLQAVLATPYGQKHFIGDASAPVPVATAASKVAKAAPNENSDSAQLSLL